MTSAKVTAFPNCSMHVCSDCERGKEREKENDIIRMQIQMRVQSGYQLVLVLRLLNMTLFPVHALFTGVEVGGTIFAILQYTTLSMVLNTLTTSSRIQAVGQSNKSKLNS